MEENLNQTQTQETVKPVEAPRKASNVVIIVLLLLIFVILGVIVGYQRLTKKVTPESNSGTEQTTQSSGTTDAVKTTEEESLTQTGTTGTTDTTSGTLDQKAKIDKDLESMDSLDLSGIENEYSEDSLGDL